jgi:hypothetical protein
MGAGGFEDGNARFRAARTPARAARIEAKKNLEAGVAGLKPAAAAASEQGSFRGLCGFLADDFRKPIFETTWQVPRTP